MTVLDEAVHVLPLVSAAVWAFVAVGAFGRYGMTSPFIRALALFCALVSAGCATDWGLLTFGNALDPASVLLLANVRTSFLAGASLVILLASIWISRGHSRFDWLLALPVVGIFAVIWGGMTPSEVPASWGPQLARNPLLFSVFVVQELAYYAVAIYLVLTLQRGRADLPPRLRRPALLSIWSLVVFVALWLATNVPVSLSNAALPPLLSSVAFIPALMNVAAFAPRTRDELGEIFRAVSKVEHRVLALYVFYRTGEPLVAVGSSRSFPIEAEQLEGVLSLVGDFVERSVRKFRGYAVTSMSFDRFGIIAVRGKDVIVGAVFEEAAYDALRSELVRGLEKFEDAHGDALGTFEGASKVADVIADDLSRLLRPPERAPAI